jgi:hypothetical protein
VTHRRDKEIARLRDYARGLGITLVMSSSKKAPPNTGATWHEVNKDNAIITIYVDKHRTTKTDFILIMLHELSHHLAWRYNGSNDTPELLAALGADEPKTEKQRELIYRMEKNDAQYRLAIVTELNIQIPIWKVLADIELDTWIYFEYWKNGAVPTVIKSSQKRKELYLKFRSKS